jgi:hypothetical protein
LKGGGSISKWELNAHNEIVKCMCGSDHIHLINPTGESNMTKFKLIGAAALLSAAIATPALAQQAVQEPGAQAFYQSLGVGSHNYVAPSYGAANALASAGNVNLSVAPARYHRHASKHQQ